MSCGCGGSTALAPRGVFSGPLGVATGPRGVTYLRRNPLRRRIPADPCLTLGDCTYGGFSAPPQGLGIWPLDLLPVDPVSAAYRYYTTPSDVEARKQAAALQAQALQVQGLINQPSYEKETAWRPGTLLAVGAAVAVLGVLLLGGAGAGGFLWWRRRRR